MGTTDGERGDKMPCYHPRIRIEETSKWQKAADGHRYHPAKIEQPHDLHQRLEELKDNINYKYQIIPCQECIGCRLEYSRQWANRGYLESKEYDENYFVTITYDEGHLPQNEEIITSEGISYTDPGDWEGTLVPEDLKKFIKNVRQIWKRDYKQDGIRFMACGEYGEEGQRPHYHIIFFNLKIPPEDLYSPCIINKNWHYKSHQLERAWTKDGEVEPRGFVDVSEATWNDIAYVARYITKKINGKQSEDHYAEKGQEKEFFRVSRMPGIGEPYFRKHWEEIYKNDEVIIKNNKGAVSMQPPRYFDQLYEQMDPTGFEKIKKNRKKRAKDTAKVKDETTSLYRLAQLEIEEHQQEERALKLRREFERKSS